MSTGPPRKAFPAAQPRPPAPAGPQRQPLGRRKMTIRANVFRKIKENVVSCGLYKRFCSWQGQEKHREVSLITAKLLLFPF